MFTIEEVHEEIIREAVEKYNAEPKYIICVEGGAVYHASGYDLLCDLINLFNSKNQTIYISQ